MFEALKFRKDDGYNKNCEGCCQVVAELSGLPPPPKNTIEQLIERSDGRCWYCGKLFGPDRDDRPTKEHKLPLSRGGPDTLDNLVAACRGCNHRKGSLTLDEFRRVRGSLFYGEGGTAVDVVPQLSLI